MVTTVQRHPFDTLPTFVGQYVDDATQFLNIDGITDQHSPKAAMDLQVVTATLNGSPLTPIATINSSK